MRKITLLLFVFIAFSYTVKAQITSYPYSEDFESGAAGWTVVDGGTGTSWALGAPAATVINSAASGTNSWTTNLTGTYSANENGWVLSPVFNLSSLSNPLIELSVWWNIEFSWDGAVLQSSIDSGSSWQNVGAWGDSNNWYTDNSIFAQPGGQGDGWTGRDSTANGSGGWVIASNSLSSLIGQTNVVFRVAFGSDAAVNEDGFAFDLFKILEGPPPANDDPAAATTLTVGTIFADNPVTGTNAGATASEVADASIPAPGCSTYSGGDVWFSLVVGASGEVTLETNSDTGSTLTDTAMAVYSGSIGAFVNIGCNDDGGAGLFSLLALTGRTPGETLYVRVFEYQNNLFDTFQVSAYYAPPLPPPTNDDCANATPYTNDFVMFAEGNCVATPNILDLSGATDDIGSDNPSCDLFDNFGVWYTWTATSAGLTFTSGTGLPGLAVYEAGTCGTLVEVGCLNNVSGIITGLTISNNYILHIWDDTAGNMVDFCLEELTPPPPPANDDCTNATGVTSLPYNEVVDASTATNNAGFIACDGGPDSMNDGVWYTFTPTTSGTVDVAITGVIGWDPEVRIYSGTCGTFVCVANADSGVTGGSENLSAVTVVSGTQYWINIGYWSGTTDNAEGPFTIDISTTDTTTLPVSEYEFENFKYFPNPVNDNLNLRAQSNIQNVSIYNMLGQEVSRISPNTVSSDVDMSALQIGVYFVNVTINDTTETIRIIKQ